MTLRDIAVAFGFEVDKKSVSAAENTIKSLKNLAGKALGALGIGFSAVQLKKFSDDCIQTASDISEMESKFDVVFRGMEKDVDGWATKFAKNIGRSKYDIKTYLADAQNLLVGFTDGSDEARRSSADLAQEMTSLALDIASFANTDEDVAVQRMTKAVMGESEAGKELGAVLNDLTRAEAMQRMGMKGTYEKLTQYDKMLVNLNAIQYQSKDAIGDCANSLDRYESKTRQQQAAMKDLKATVGNGLLPVMSELKSWQIKLTQGAVEYAKKIFGETEEENKLQKAMEKVHGIMKKMKPDFDRFIDSVRRWIDFIKRIIDKLGGVENVLKILGIVAGAFFAVIQAAKIMRFIKDAKKMADLMGKLSKVFEVGKLKVLAIIAVIVVLALVIEDFVQFLRGNDSIIGEVFDKLGIGSENARQKIFEAFGKAKDFLLKIWPHIRDALIAVLDEICEAAKIVFDALATAVKIIFEVLKAFWNKWGEDIKAWFSTLWGFLGSIAQGFMDVIIGIADFVKSVFTGDWQGAWEAIKQIFFGVMIMISNFGSAIWETLKLLFKIGLDFVSGIWNSAWGAISTFFIGIWNKIVAYFSGIWTKIKDGVTSGISSIKENIVTGFNAAIDWIKALPEQALQWGADIISGIAKGIWNSIGKIGEAAKGVGNKIKSFLHFSVPDEGPLVDYESWMPDFMEGMAKGISNNEGTVIDKIRSLANGISTLMQAATAKTRTATTSTVNNTTSSVTQNVNIDNTYNGGTTESQKTVSKGMKKSAADATTEMARALAYARG